jgi:RHS repeat-associated protein
MTSGSAGTVSYNDPSHVHAATSLSSIPNQYASYDAMGNMTCRTTDTTGSQSCASGTQTGATMSYDNAGRLASWTAPTGLNENDQYLYDNEGNRVLQRSSTTTNGTTTSSDTITFDNLTEVSIAAGVTTITNYYRVSGQRVALRKGAILSYLLPDFLGSDSIALNANGSVQAVQLFAPYGQVRYSDQVMPTDYSFAGQRLDLMSGLLYDNARYYDPVSGRFTRADTVQTNTMGQDPYAYVGESPETKTDPTGTMYYCPDGCGGGSSSTTPPHQPTPPAPPSQTTPGPQPGSPTVTQVVSALSSVAGVAGKLLWEGIDLVFNVSGMWHDVQTLADGNASWWVRAGAAADLGVSIFTDINMLDGEGEAARAAELGAEIAEKGVADVAESGATDVIGDVAEGACSFIFTTKVATQAGEQAIGTVKVGEKVVAYNPLTKKTELKPILHVWINHDNDLVDLTITHVTHAKGAKPSSEVIHTNKKHPFLTVEKGFLPVGQIKLGMHVVEADGQLGVITGWKVVPGVQTMYNLEVAQDHTFVVGVGMWVVHNCSPVSPGDAGAYKDLKGVTGDGLTPHHMPQGSLAQHFGFEYREGGSIVMDDATHRDTYNYAGLANGTKRDIISGGYTFRQALAESIRDYRSLVPNSNSSVRQLIEYWNNTYPELMQK